MVSRFFLVCLLFFVSASVSVASTQEIPAGLTIKNNNQTTCSQCPEKCQCVGLTVFCTDISEIPTCFPERHITRLVVQNSPNLTLISENTFAEYGTFLVSLILRRTGLRNVHQNAFNTLAYLEELEISSSDMLDTSAIDFSLNFPKLQTLNFSNSERLSYIGFNGQFKGLKALKVFDFSHCDIRSFSTDIFEGFENLMYLNLKSNKRLRSIPQMTLYHMWHLEQIDISDCGLTVLYSEYFSSPYELGRLKEVKASKNEWKCETMCDFFKWTDDNPDFQHLFMGGVCKSPSYVTDIPLNVLNLESINSCQGLPIVISLVVVTCSLMFTCCLLCALKNCCIGMCRNSEDRGENCSQATSRTNGAADFSDEIPTPEGEWGIDPPTYDMVFKESDIGNIASDCPQNTCDEDSMDGIPPPPYEGLDFNSIN